MLKGEMCRMWSVIELSLNLGHCLSSGLRAETSGPAGVCWVRTGHWATDHLTPSMPALLIAPLCSQGAWQTQAHGQC